MYFCCGLNFKNLLVVHRERDHYDNLSELSIDVIVQKIEKEKQKEENKTLAAEDKFFPQF